MGHVYIFDKNAEDFSTTGLCGALTPTVCEHEEIAGGMSAITLEHPFDELGRWKHLQRGNVLKAPCRVRTTPEIEGGQVVTAVERWSVKATATQAQRGVYSKAVKGKRKATAKPGTEVIVVAKGAERYKVKWGKAAGWIAHAALDFVLAETLPDGVNGIESVAPPWIVKPQLFRIQSVDADTDAGNITVYAVHISYDLSYNLARYKNDEPLTAQEALDGIFGSCDFLREVEAYTDIADTRTSAEWVNVSPVEALLAPETGFCARWGAELVRDDFEMYFLRRAGRDRGVRLMYGKNLLGVNCETSDEQVATAILPLGEKKDGSPLYLTDYPDNYDNYVLSPHADEYPFERAYVLKCEDCQVEKGKKGVTVSVARARMREQAQRLFDEEKVDLPSINMTVNFLALGDTVEYQQYRNLEPVFLYDMVPVIDGRHGIEVSADVHRTLWDCLLERMIEIELGNVRAGENIYGWQITGLDGGKLNGGSVPGSAIEDGGIPEDKLDPDLQETLRKAWADIEEAQGMIDYANTWLDTLDAQLEAVTIAVGDNAGAIAALQVAADAIRAAVRDAEGNIAALEITADQIATAVQDAEGNISTLQQQAGEMASTVANVSGELSTIRQTVNSVGAAVSGLGGRISALELTIDGVTVTLHRPGSTQYVKITALPTTGSGYTGLGVSVYDGSLRQGSFLATENGWVEVSGRNGVAVDANMIHLRGGSSVRSMAGENFLDVNDFNISASKAITVSSDLRLKQDVAPLGELEELGLLERLAAIRYRFKADPRKLHFGFGAQWVQELLKGTTYEDAALVADEDPDHLGLCYEELIALLVVGWQKHRSEIAALRAEIAAMKGGPVA